MEAAVFSDITAKNAAALSSFVTKIKLRIHVQDKLSNIQCPTLIISGKVYFIVKEAPQLAKRLISNSELVFIVGAGHYPHIENSESFFNELNNFIKKTTTSNE